MPSGYLVKFVVAHKPLRLSAESLDFGQNGTALFLGNIDTEFLGFQANAVEATLFTQHDPALSRRFFLLCE
jgi:hypothetical protein